MVLGELYKPKGLALETAMTILETSVENTFACNVAYGCSNNCGYCYVGRYTRRSKQSCQVRLPKKPPVELVKHQLEHTRVGMRPSHLGVFLSFLTDPFLPIVQKSTEELIEDCLLDRGICVATLSKLGTSYYYTRHGMTIVSLDHEFWLKFEPNTMPPLRRIETLEQLKGEKEYVWVSMEPYPTASIYKQKLEDVLEELNFVDLILFGKWNYDKRASDMQAKEEYHQLVPRFMDWCKSNNIRYHVKSQTIDFIR